MCHKSLVWSRTQSTKEPFPRYECRASSIKDFPWQKLSKTSTMEKSLRTLTDVWSAFSFSSLIMRFRYPIMASLYGMMEFSLRKRPNWAQALRIWVFSSLSSWIFRLKSAQSVCFNTILSLMSYRKTKTGQAYMSGPTVICEMTLGENHNYCKKK